MDPDECLDRNNHDFYYKEIANELNVKLVSGNTGNTVWTVRYGDGDKNAIIYAGVDYPNIESFTHAILHLYLFINGFKTFYLNYIKYFSNVFKTLIKPNETMDGIANSIAHFKMFPLFTEKLKMDKAKFLPNRNNISDDDLKNLIRDQNGNQNQKQYYFTNFIRHYFDSRYPFSFVDSERYENYLTQLKNIDEQLFAILEERCTEWEQDLCNYDNEDFFITLIPELDKYLNNLLE